MLFSVVAVPMYIQFYLETRHLQTLFFVVDTHTHTHTQVESLTRVPICLPVPAGGWGPGETCVSQGNEGGLISSAFQETFCLSNSNTANLSPLTLKIVL